MTVEELKRTIIDNLNILMRKNSGITQKSLSLSIGASESYIQKVMSGNCTPTLDKLVEICNYFDIPITVLLTPNTEVSQEAQIIAEKLKHLSPDAIRITHQQVNYMCVAEKNLYNKKP